MVPNQGLVGTEKLMGSATALLCAFRGVYKGSTLVDKVRVATVPSQSTTFGKLEIGNSLRMRIQTWDI